MFSPLHFSNNFILRPGERTSINIGATGNELPTTFHKAKDHDPPGSRSDRPDHHLGDKTEKAQLSISRT